MTLLGFTGPLTVGDIANALGIRRDSMGHLLAALQHQAYVRIASVQPFMLWESTGIWAPDPRGTVHES